MDTNEAAQRLNVSPRNLRAFLRSTYSTFVAVGSGSRYEFTEAEFSTLSDRYQAWRSAGKPRPRAERKAPVAETSAAERKALRDKEDQEKWDEEGPVVLADIRDPRVRARVKADARAADDRLMLMLFAKGLHITQVGNVS